MTNNDTTDLSWDEWDELTDEIIRPEETGFDQVVDKALSRRSFLTNLVVFGSGAAVMGTGLLKSSTALADNHRSRFAFKPIPVATDATIHVPEGYSWKIVTSWGDPLFSDTPEFNHEIGGQNASDSEKVFGENTDGMKSFIINGAEIIAVNNEYANTKTNLPNHADGKAGNLEDVLKLQNLQGVTIMQVAQQSGGWNVVKDSPYNRRITHNTPMKITGPAAGHDLLKTQADPTGTKSLGTFNNCGAGKTPWGTYLTCEENFNGYFGSTDENFKRSEGFKRYGVGLKGRYGYENFDERFDISKNPNEPNRGGWIVEIDPSDASSTPMKRTALGRFKHENAACVVARDGRVIVYMGDDERGEFMYKYVSNGVYVPGGDTSALLVDGQLYVAKFNDDASGEWIALTPEATQMTEAEILIHARIASSKVGATTMDRPEWIAVNPVAVEAYCCLTNNKNRGKKPNAGGDDTSVNAANPREANNYGQIVRWYPNEDDHASTTFKWDLYVMAGNPNVHDDAYAGSDNVNKGNLFNSPDGMMFDTTGILWIQTDGNDSDEGDYQGMGNNQMLAGDPATGQIERFLTGPKGSEVTGLTWSADRRTMFVGIQHPKGNFPGNEGDLPRSSIIAISRDDGALVG